MDCFDQQPDSHRMSASSFRDFGRVDRFLVGAIGDPGKRTFYLFIEASGLSTWFKCEKGQVAALGDQGLELLSNLGWNVDEKTVETILTLSANMPAPTTEEDVTLRVRSIAMRIDSMEALTLMLEGTDGDDRVVFTITAEQLRAAALLALEAVHAGRQRCPNCLLPEDPDGHDCPSGNGHRLPR